MFPSLTIVDNFLSQKDFIVIRNKVRDRGFKTVAIQEQPGTNAPLVEYENVNIEDKFSEFQVGLEQLFAMPVKMHMQAFRLGFKGSQLHNKVHADHCCAKMAAVYYMNNIEDCYGGTAFWRHELHQWEFMPTVDQLDEVGYSIEDLARDWQDENAWRMVTLAGMAPNRLITYPTAAFHSRWPFEGLGEGSNARLVYVAMFDIIG